MVTLPCVVGCCSLTLPAGNGNLNFTVTVFVDLTKRQLALHRRAAGSVSKHGLWWQVTVFVWLCFCDLFAHLYVHGSACACACAIVLVVCTGYMHVLTRSCSSSTSPSFSPSK